MRKISLLSVALLITGSLASQQVTPDTATLSRRGILLDFYAGYSIPFGKYASTDVEDDFSGYATGGYVVQGGVSWMGKNILGLGFSYAYQHNAIQKNYRNDTLPGYRDALGARPWSSHYILAGPVLKASSGKFSFAAKAQIGVVLAYSSLFTIWVPTDAVDSTAPVPLKESRGPGIGVAVQALAAGGYQLRDNIALQLTLSYLGANPVRTRDYYYYYWAIDPHTGRLMPIYQGGEIERKRRISSFNISLGVTIKL